MKQLYLILFLFFVSVSASLAQDHYLELNPNCPAIQSPFTKVQVIDNLANKDLLGFVQKGAFNRREQIRYDGSIADTLGKYFITNNSSDEKSRELVVVINELFLSETTGTFRESGSLKLSIRLFSENPDGNFSELFSIDSVYTVKGMDVTKKLLRSVNDQFCKISEKAAGFQQKNLESSRSYTLSDLYMLDHLEKLSVPFYVAEKPVGGIYRQYNALKVNKPDEACEIFVDDANPKKIRVYKLYKIKNRKFRLDTEGIYAVCNGERVYKATPFGFYEVRKTGTDFFYDRPASISEANNGSVVGAAAFGLAGAVLASGLMDNRPKVYRFKINYRYGNSIPVAAIQ
ncbi:hypothetical protein ACFP1I_13690 [Dyadobacter subterraneus]|uniref:Uncharacterized protein n=1 Tax=Dyadobacter subterraneus TaxID=2773304 RepID=A0ABR9WBC8_9BACT|nr:hypothetical protein [Dyadobacter subterraneus]MBE9462286.1 hypothetical protein [Dyadobacter subterraneus]